MFSLCLVFIFYIKGRYQIYSCLSFYILCSFTAKYHIVFFLFENENSQIAWILVFTLVLCSYPSSDTIQHISLSHPFFFFVDAFLSLFLAPGSLTDWYDNNELHFILFVHFTQLHTSKLTVQVYTNVQYPTYCTSVYFTF